MDEKDKIKCWCFFVEFWDYEIYKDVVKSLKDIEMNCIVKIIDEYGFFLIRKILVLCKNVVMDEVNVDLIISIVYWLKGFEWDMVVFEEDFFDLLLFDILEKKDIDEIVDELNLMYVVFMCVMKIL